MATDISHNHFPNCKAIQLSQIWRKYNSGYCKQITYSILSGNSWNNKESYSFTEVGRSELLPQGQEGSTSDVGGR